MKYGAADGPTPGDVRRRRYRIAVRHIVLMRIDHPRRRGSGAVFAAGKADAALSNHGRNHVVCGWPSHRRPLCGECTVRRIRAFAHTEADVAANGVGEQERVLRDDADLRAQCGKRPVSRVDAVDEHTAGGWVVETGDKVDLPAPVSPRMPSLAICRSRFRRGFGFGACEGMWKSMSPAMQA